MLSHVQFHYIQFVRLNIFDADCTLHTIVALHMREGGTVRARIQINTYLLTFWYNTNHNLRKILLQLNM